MENVQGSDKRLNWIRERLRSKDRLMEFGCGTGAMITLPLLIEGYDVVGMDRDVESIECGRQVLRQHNLDPDRLRAEDVSALSEASMDVVIASEVFEHIESPELRSVLSTLHSKLRPRGRLLVTVPNGFGWFELESFFWNRLGIGPLFLRLHIPGIMSRIKRLIGIAPGSVVRPNTLSESPHVQRFTRRSVRSTLEGAGFDVVSIEGTVMFAGQFSHILFGGVKPFIRLNLWLGERYPGIAAGYLIDCLRRI